MTKKVFLQDVVPSGKRSIRNIPLPHSKSQSIRDLRDTREIIHSEPELDSEPETEKKSKKVPPKSKSKRSAGFPRLGLWAAAVVVVLILVYAGSFLFVRATVSVIPKEVNTPMNVSGKAVSEPASNELTFTLVTLSREASKQIPASGEEKVQKKASGKIVIYNNISKDPQKLIANTRFESTDGLIFRIQEAVTVPGQKIVNGATVPGSLTVTVYADQAGEKYNIGLSDFTIPGFKGDPKFSKINAKSDPANPIKGGFVGTVPKVSPSDAATAKASIETQLKSELREGIKAHIPDTHVLLTNAYTFSFEELPQETTAGNTTIATTREKGTIYGILFEREELSKYLAEHSTEITTSDVSVSNLEDLTFTLDNVNSFNPTTVKDVSFKITGDTNFVWNIDSEAVSASLADKKRAQINTILANFEGIDRASVSIKPLWLFTLPENPDKITVEVQRAE